MTTTPNPPLMTPRQQAPPDSKVLSAQCHTGILYPDFKHGHPACEYPGYEHPLLEWMGVPCTCTCHEETQP